MNTIQAVFRYSPDEEVAWSAYSYPQAIYTQASSLTDLRSSFAEAARFHYSPEAVEIVEHLEVSLTDGVYVRIARDKYETDRRSVFQQLQAGLNVPGQAKQLQDMYRAATGDVVVVACVQRDPLQWVFDQLDDEDTLLIAAPATAYGVWWIPFAGAESDGADMAGEPVLSRGLSRESTIGDLMLSHKTQRVPLAV